MPFHIAAVGATDRGGLEGQAAAGRTAEDRRGPAGFLDQRGGVFDPSVGGVWFGVAAVAAPSAVVVEDGEAPLERAC